MREESRSLPKIGLKQWGASMRGWLRIKKSRTRLMLPSFRASRIFNRELILDLIQALLVKKEGLQRAAFKIGSQVQEIILWEGNMIYLLQDLLLVGHVILKVFEATQSVLPATLKEEGILKGFHKENLWRKDLPHLMDKVRQVNR